MFISAQKDGLQLNDPEPTLEELGTVALTKRRWKGVLKIETLLVIAIGLVSYVLSAVAGSVLSFFRHGYDFSVHLHDLSRQFRRFSSLMCFSSFEPRAEHPCELWSSYATVVSQ